MNIRITVNPERREWDRLTRRAFSDDGAVEAKAAKIIERVRIGGDKALMELAEELDGAKLVRLEATADVVEAAALKVAPELKKAIETAAANIRKFHEAQLVDEICVETMPGVHCVQRAVPIQHVGLYVPGGTAPLLSTVLMLAIPAKTAGCKEIIMCTPPDSSGLAAPEILYAAAVCGVDRIFLAGGAQAIAAMAYGTETIPKVDKIFGPGNRYVTKAKQLVSVSQTAIDIPAGPSEVMIIADGTARPEFAAADMLSQAEHGPDSQAILVCDSRSFAERTAIYLKEQSAKLKRLETVRRSLGNSHIIVMDEEDDMIDFANEYAAEHLIISMREAWEVAGKITSAGSIFLGNYSPESAGDYASGTNHTLPTAGWAKSYGGVNTDSFMKKITIQELSSAGLQKLSGAIITMAEAEGLDAHANAVRIRTGSIE